MSKVIDTSISAGSISVRVILGRLNVSVIDGWHTSRAYGEDDVDDILPLAEDSFRNAGKAAAGAVIGGLLTGGIGFLAGAAIGGRRRTDGMYAIVLKDGNHIVIETSEKKLIAKLKTLGLRKKLRPSEPPRPRPDPDTSRVEPTMSGNILSANTTQEALRLLSSGRTPDEQP